MASVGLKRTLSAVSNVHQQNNFRRSLVTNAAGSFYEAPSTHRYGRVGAVVTVLTGVSIGTLMSKTLASYLQEHDLFSP